MHQGIDPHSQGWRNRLPIPRLDETTLIHRVFGGYLRSQVRCTKCGYRSNTYDPFLDLALEVSKKSSNSVASAFGEFTRRETLDAANKWTCSGCKKRVCATKKLTVFRPPLTLCIQLKRFTFGQAGAIFYKGMNFKGVGGSKITKPIEFPSNLKLPLSDGRKCNYALTGVVVHVGGSASSGHYTAFVKRYSPAGHAWYHADDSYVDSVSENVVLRQRNAYVLFYCRTEVKLELPSPPQTASEDTHVPASPPSTLRHAELDLQISENHKSKEDGPGVKIEYSTLPGATVKQQATDPVYKKEIDATGRDKDERSPGKLDDSYSLWTQLASTKGNDDKTASPTSAKKFKGSKTRVVVDRDSQSGQLEVMIGPRSKRKLPWSPRPWPAQPSRGTRELLGTKVVAEWNETGDEGPTAIDRSRPVAALKKSESARKRRLQSDRWDNILDQGKVSLLALFGHVCQSSHIYFRERRPK